MAADQPPKKDLTSLLDLSKLELHSGPVDPMANLPAFDDAIPPSAPVQENEFAPFEQNEDNLAAEKSHGAELADPDEIASIEVSPSVVMEVPHSSTPDESAVPIEASAPPPDTSGGVEPSSDIVINDRESPVLSLAMKTGTPQVAQSQKPATTGYVQKKQDFSAIKNFGEKLAIGQPRIEASPAFSLMASGKFDEKKKHLIELAIKSEDFGVRFEDIEVQLSNGKLFVPQISEFAAITLAQKIRDVVDDIQIGLAGDVFKGSTAEMDEKESGGGVFIDASNYAQHREEVHDLSTEPRSEHDLFSSHLAEPEGFKITRILSSVTASEILTQEIAKSPNSRAFEDATEKLTRALVSKAFVLGAHGIVGVSFTVLPIEGAADPRRAYRLLASATAVRTRKT